MADNISVEPERHPASLDPATGIGTPAVPQPPPLVDFERAVQGAVAAAVAQAQVALPASKGVLQSRTVISIAVAALASIAGHYGHQFGSADQAALIDNVANTIQYGSLAAAAIFRVLATKPLK